MTGKMLATYRLVLPSPLLAGINSSLDPSKQNLNRIKSVLKSRGQSRIEDDKCCTLHRPNFGTHS